MTLYEFLKDKNNVFWDFTNDCGCVAYQEIEDVIEKYFVYKSVDPKMSKSVYGMGQHFAISNSKKYKGIQDPDVKSPLLQEIYKILWEDICKEQWMNGDDGETIQADTMTSVQHTLNKVVEDEIETDKEREEIRKKVGEHNKCSINYCLHLYATAPEEFSSRLRKVKGLELFLSMYHTIGNFIPTPRGFNRARSGKQCDAEYDYWDLTLLKIREWYVSAETEEEKEKIILELLHKKEMDQVCQNCKEWLKYYEERGSKEDGWKNFINSNYLQDFVKGDDYKPISFCENHDWNNIKVDDHVEFFMTVSSLIYLRGKRLLEALEEKLNN